MENSKIKNVPDNICECRCPCHFAENKSQKIKPGRNSDDVSNLASFAYGGNLPKFARPRTCPPAPKRVAQISFAETYQISEEDSEAYSPFRVKIPSPAGIAVSKSFLHVKNIVKNMTARWESLTEPMDRLPKRCSLMNGSANTENWKRDPFQIDDEKRQDWKHISEVPDNIENHLYTLQPLQNNTNLIPFNIPASSYPNNELQIQEIQYSPGPDNNSFHQHTSYVVEEVDNNSTDITNEFEPHLNKSRLDNSANMEYTSHSTNPFKLAQTKHSRELLQLNVPIPSNITTQNRLGLQDPVKPLGSIQSEVRHIKKSFEDEVDEIAANVNRSFDSKSHHPHSTDKTAAVVNPVERHINLWQNTESAEANIENFEHAQENEWNVNTGIPLSSGSKGVNKINAGDVAPTVHSVQTQVGTICPSLTEHFQKTHVGKVERVKKTTSIDLENPKIFTLTKKSYDEQLTRSNNSQTATENHHEDSKRRHSAPSKNKSYLSQHRRTFLSEEDDNGGVRCTGGCKSNTNKSTENQTTDVAIQASPGSCNGPVLDSPESHSEHDRDIKNMTKKEMHENTSSERTNTSQIDQTISKFKELNLVKSSNGNNSNPGYQNNTLLVETAKSNNLECPKAVHVQRSTKLKENDNTLPELSHLRTGTSDQEDSTYLALISIPSNSHTYEIEMKPGMCKENANVATKMRRRQESTEESGDDQRFLAGLSKEYNEVVATPSSVHVEPIGHSISVTNAFPEVHVQEDHQDERRRITRHSISTTTIGATMKRPTLYDKVRTASNSATVERNIGKRGFYICHKCRKIVESGEAIFYSNDGFEIAWHSHCFKCFTCEKDLSSTNHSFFEEEPYCLEHYVCVTNLPKCFKCEELIFDCTYTSAAGNFWHQDHFTCQACRRPLVDTKYVFVQNKHVYCFQCHEKHFPKLCSTCQRQIFPQEPYVKGGDTFWHSSISCLYCSFCKGSLVGRSLFFRRDGCLYCNRYCALQEM